MAKKRSKAQEKGDGCIYNFVIYDSPEDYPGMYVGRWWKVNNSGVHPFKSCTVVEKTEENLEELRSVARDWGLVCLGRDKMDAESIKEVWI